MTKLKHFSTLEEYCEGINIPPPKWKLFDARSFEDNMKTVHAQMPPFKHEFYAIAMKLEGSGSVSTGNYKTETLKATVFFNSPYQILHWDIAPDWKGYYVIFSEDFYRKSHLKKRLTEVFPFLLVDNTVPLEVTEQEASAFLTTFQDMIEELELDAKESEEIIQNYLQVLLLKVSRLFVKNVDNKKMELTHDQRNNDLNLVGRFKAMIETSFYPDQSFGAYSPHQVQFYADKLSIHPNHLNAVIKRITSNSASELVQKHVLALAKSKLINSDRSVKEIAYDLYYEYPNHFANFFKRHTIMTPSQYRKNSTT
ncbi:MAG: helix-turn-helix domain-containing protein [Bacteroidota bacterium]